MRKRFTAIGAYSEAERHSAGAPAGALQGQGRHQAVGLRVPGFCQRLRGGLVFDDRQGSFDLHALPHGKEDVTDPAAWQGPVQHIPTPQFHVSRGFRALGACGISFHQGTVVGRCAVD